jgi:hypothetical protein
MRCASGSAGRDGEALPLAALVAHSTASATVRDLTATDFRELPRIFAAMDHRRGLNSYFINKRIEWDWSRSPAPAAMNCSAGTLLP